MTTPRHRDVQDSWVSALAEALRVPVGESIETTVAPPAAREPELWRAAPRHLHLAENPRYRREDGPSPARKGGVEPPRPMSAV